MSLDWLADELALRRQQDLLRTARVVRHLGSGRIELDGRVLNNFGSNDYLGLATRSASMSAEPTDACNNTLREVFPEVPEEPKSPHPRPLSRKTVRGKMDRLGFGSGASPLVTGYTSAHAALEGKLAEFEGTEAAILFSTGYAANVGTIAALATAGDIIFSDALNHASLIDGCRLSRAEVMVYPHGDDVGLSGLMHRHRGSARRAFIVTDSLFSMDGDIAPLREIADLAERFDAVTIVDEAHATGVYGPRGRGIVEELDLEKRISVRIGTLSKALGGLGGFVVGSSVLIAHLRNFARTYVYSTSMPAALAEAAIESLDFAHDLHQERARLRLRGKSFRESLRRIGLHTGGVDSPIIPIYLPSPQTALEWSRRLGEHGHFVPAIRPPTVPRDRSLLRVSLSTLHSDEQIASLTEDLRI